MAAITAGVTVRASATAEQHRGGLLEPQFIGHLATAEMGPIAEPAVAAAAAAAELVNAGWQVQGLGAARGGIGITPASRAGRLMCHGIAGLSSTATVAQIGHDPRGSPAAQGDRTERGERKDEGSAWLGQR